MSGGAEATSDGQDVAYSYSIPTSGGYDSAGNVKAVTDSVTGVWTYQYDTLNRLMTATPTSGSYLGYNGCWAYDSFGNRTAENYQAGSCPSHETSVSATAHYNANNQVIWTSVNGAMNGFTYDGAGNVLYDGANKYLYDVEGRLCAVQNVAIAGIPMTGYLYGADGARVAKGTLSSWTCNAAATSFSPTSLYVLGASGEQVTEVGLSGSTSTWRHTNVFAGGKLLATYAPNTNGATDTFFALTDWLGSKHAEITPDSTFSTFFSLPYGNGLSTAGDAADAAEHHFTGKERDSESGNDYFGARYYAPTMGRWLSPDPMGMAFADPTDPQSLNHYSYVLNNPLIFSDPDGLDCIYTNNQSTSSVDVTILRGDCKSDKDSGVFVDGTVDANSVHYYVDSSTGASSLGYNFTNDDDPSKAGAGVTDLGKVTPPDTDGQLAPSIQTQFIPQLATTSFNFNRALPVPCGVGTNFGANIGPARIGWDVNTSKGLRFSANLRAGQVGPMAANLGLNGRSASLNISDTPFALTAGLSGNRATSLGMSVGFGPGGNTKGFGSARAGAYVLTGNFQDGCRAW